MTLYLHLRGEKVAEVFNLTNCGERKWTFTCKPPIFDAESDDYAIHPVDGAPMRIMISNITSDGTQSLVEAVEP